jgi:hypothetical protein
MNPNLTYVEEPRPLKSKHRDFTNFVWFSIFQNSAAYGHYVAALSQSQRLRGEVADGVWHYLNKATEVLKITPTAGSQLPDERRENYRTKIANPPKRVAHRIA